MPAENDATPQQRARLAARLIAELRGAHPPFAAPVIDTSLFAADRSVADESRPSRARRIVSKAGAEDLYNPRERFILLAGPLALAVVEGRKRVTRRLVGADGATKPAKPCPYGVAGDRLVVREKWGYEGQFYNRRAPAKPPYVYAADGTPPDARFLAWKPSLHMPRIASRATLTISSIAYERLADITLQDAIDEGCPAGRLHDPIGWFCETWDRFYAGRGAGWADNPWVWVIAFDVTARKETV